MIGSGILVLCFKGGNELVKLDIDRNTKTLFVTSSKTSYKKTPMSWSNLFDARKEVMQDRITEKLDDNTFKTVIMASMLKNGYYLVENGSS